MINIWDAGIWKTVTGPLAQHMAGWHQWGAAGPRACLLSRSLGSLPRPQGTAVVTGTRAYQGAEAALPALHTGKLPPLGMQTAQPAPALRWGFLQEAAGSRGRRLGVRGWVGGRCTFAVLAVGRQQEAGGAGTAVGAQRVLTRVLAETRG